MQGSPQPEDRFPSVNSDEATAETDRTSSPPARGDDFKGSRVLGETELDSALQLLVERAQYITGATGTALALPQGEEMVCRASSGASAPVVGARLQVRSGLTGESISRRQLLRCDNAESDPRVNLEACRALGIASIVVLPLLRRNGEVRGLFELFSDHPYAFEERDLVALERMADLTLTALDLAEQAQNSALAPRPRLEPGKPIESPVANGARPAPAIPINIPLNAPPDIPTNVELAEPAALSPTALSEEPPVISPSSAPSSPLSLSLPPSPTLTTTATASVPEAMLRVQKCESCGFPVSEGRTLCLDCEKKDNQNKELAKVEQERRQSASSSALPDAVSDAPLLAAPSASSSPSPVEFVPAFLANVAPVKESWMANHVNLLAVAVLIVGILVAVVVFR